MPPTTTATLLPLLLLTTLLTLLPTARAQLDSTSCPPASALVYSPFTPWWHFYNRPTDTRQQCWNTASCLFTSADEARKQQFAATALVMGLIPLTLKDIAWPERRSVPVSRTLPFALEAVVLGLGLVPEVVGDARGAAVRNSRFARWAWGLRRRVVVGMAGGMGVWLGLCYGALAVTETYSKRAALGCPWPVWALMWYVVGIVPGAVHAGLARVRARWMREWGEGELGGDGEEMVAFVGGAAGEDGGAGGKGDGRGRVVRAAGKARAERGPSAVQGAGEWWVVQLIWSFYYTAGTLIFTSIMAVTVIELFVWVMVCFATTGASKLLAVFLCLAFEDNPW